MRIVLLGAPGAGKGTVSSILIEKYNLVQISTGDILRKAVKENTELGKKAKTFMDSGLFVPDELVLEIISERLQESDCQNGYILDGFPRTIKQAQELKKILQKSGMDLDRVIELRVDSEVVTQRILNRRTCSNSSCQRVYNVKDFPPVLYGKCDDCGAELVNRADETPEKIKQRLQDYEDKTQCLVDYYDEEGLLYTVTELNLDNIIKEIDSLFV